MALIGALLATSLSYVIIFLEEYMKDYSGRQIIGPVMVGPSSSHTAGAVRIAKCASKIAGDFERVEFYLHGSFAKTYKGHGTDKALLAGVMGFNPDSDEIKDAYEIAKKLNIKYEFKTIELEDAHPNTVEIVFYKGCEFQTVTGSSLGGGTFVITNIDGIDLHYNGDFPVLLLRYEERPGVIANVSKVLAGVKLNIETINTQKDRLTNLVTLTIEVDKNIPADILKAIDEADIFLTTRYVEV